MLTSPPLCTGGSRYPEVRLNIDMLEDGKTLEEKRVAQIGHHRRVIFQSALQEDMKQKDRGRILLKR
jgi:hypothetical protein